MNMTKISSCNLSKSKLTSDIKDQYFTPYMIVTINLRAVFISLLDIPYMDKRMWIPDTHILFFPKLLPKV